LRSSLRRIHSGSYLLFLLLLFSMLLITSCRFESGIPVSTVEAVEQPDANLIADANPPVVMEEIRVTPSSDLYFTLTPPHPEISPSPSHIPASTPTPTLSPTPKTIFRMCTPLQDHTLTDLLEIISFPYDPPPEGKDTGHHGVDFAYYRRGDRLSILGVPIQAVLPGKAAAVILNRAPYGYMLIVETGLDDISPALKEHVGLGPQESLYLLYAHMDSAPFLEVGEPVACGGLLGEVGNTPPEWSSAPHLHFEARIGPPGAVFESMAFYSKTASPEEMDSYRRWRMSAEFRLVDPLDLLVFGLQDSELP
jgi:murein DD-endopeptidase MepM/ murein hydrolase activator NlpD